MIEPLSFVSYGVQKFYNCMACCLCSDAHLPSKMIMYITKIHCSLEIPDQKENGS